MRCMRRKFPRILGRRDLKHPKSGQGTKIPARMDKKTTTSWIRATKSLVRWDMVGQSFSKWFFFPLFWVQIEGMGFLLLCVRDCMEGFNSGFLAVGLTFVLCLLQDCCFMVWHYFSLGGMHWAWLSSFSPFGPTEKGWKTPKTLLGKGTSPFWVQNFLRAGDSKSKCLPEQTRLCLGSGQTSGGAAKGLDKLGGALIFLVFFLVDDIPWYTPVPQQFVEDHGTELGPPVICYVVHWNRDSEEGRNQQPFRSRMARFR